MKMLPGTIQNPCAEISIDGALMDPRNSIITYNSAGDGNYRTLQDALDVMPADVEYYLANRERLYNV